MKNIGGIVYSLFFFLTACAQSSSTQVATIKMQRAASNAAIARHDVQGIARYWLPDFVQVRGNATFLVGKEAVSASWTDLFKHNATVAYIRTPDEIIISSNDTLAWENGSWKAVQSYSKGGKYSAMWRKANHEWKLQAELFVSLY